MGDKPIFDLKIEEDEKDISKTSSQSFIFLRNWDVVRVFVVRVVVRLPFSSFPASLTTPNIDH